MRSVSGTGIATCPPISVRLPRRRARDFGRSSWYAPRPRSRVLGESAGCNLDAQHRLRGVVGLPRRGLPESSADAENSPANRKLEGIAELPTGPLNPHRGGPDRVPPPAGHTSSE